MFGSIFKKEPKFVPKKYVLFNVNTFNEWFNDKDNGAKYTNSGFFLRTDKLSISHIEEYLVKCHGLKLSDFDFNKEIVGFYSSVCKDWLKRKHGGDMLYSNIEDSIIRWSNDGTKTAGVLARKIVKTIKQHKVF